MEHLHYEELEQEVEKGEGERRTGGGRGQGAGGVTRRCDLQGGCNIELKSTLESSEHWKTYQVVDVRGCLHDELGGGGMDKGHGTAAGQYDG